MGIGSKFGITAETGNNIQTDGLVYYIDAAYKKSYTQLSSDAFNLASGSLTPTASLYNDTSGSFDAGPKAWNFDGVDAYISFPQSTGQFSGDPMSFEWVWKKDDTSDGVILMDRPTYSNAYGIEIWVSGTKVYVRGSGTTILDSTSTISIDTWYHTVVTFNSTTANIYINGVLNKSGTVNALADSSYDFYIGTYPTLGSVNWDGELAFLRIYDYTLTAADVLQNYNAGKDRFNL